MAGQGKAAAGGIAARRVVMAATWRASTGAVLMAGNVQAAGLAAITGALAGREAICAGFGDDVSAFARHAPGANDLASVPRQTPSDVPRHAQPSGAGVIGRASGGHCQPHLIRPAREAKTADSFAKILTVIPSAQAFRLASQGARPALQARAASRPG